MSQSVILALTCVATGAVAAARFVGFDGAQIAVAGASTLGVAEYPAVAGSAYAVNVLGTARVEAGGVVALGGPVKADALGRAIAQGGAGAIAGYALSPSAAAGDVITILLGR